MDVMTAYCATLVFVLGAIVGSFLNVLIYRIPREGDWLGGRSACPVCGQAIRWYQNIPVLSYLALRGRCAGCKNAISVRYPLVELATAALFAAAYFSPQAKPQIVTAWLLVAILVTVSMIDMEHQLIPNKITFPASIAGFVLAIFNPKLTLTEATLGFFLGAGVLVLLNVVYFAVRRRDGLGMGDAKLLAVMGLFLGYKALLPIFMVAAFSAFFVVVGLRIFSQKTADYAIPFGPFLALGGLACLFVEPMVIQGLLY